MEDEAAGGGKPVLMVGRVPHPFAVFLTKGLGKVRMAMRIAGLT